MSLLKSGQIQNCCHPNALLTLKEYLMDYASPETRSIGEKLIGEQISAIPNDKARALCTQHLGSIAEGKRDFRF